MELTGKKTYKEFKAELYKEMLAAANSFCRIGYLLRIAKDTTILHESGYANINEFAKEEYNLSKDMVSRYIRINEKYSEGGYGEHIAAAYKDYGVAKLAEMITLPDVIADNIPPDMTKGQIQNIRKEIREEEKITDIEVALETPEKPLEEFENIFEQWMYAYFKENTEKFRTAAELLKKYSENPMYSEKEFAGKFSDVLSPTGVDMLPARIKGLGKLMLSINGIDEPPVLINVRTGESEETTWQQLTDAFKFVYEMCFEEIESEHNVDENKENVIEDEHSVNENKGNVIKDRQNVDENKNTGQRETTNDASVSKEPENAISGSDFEAMNPPEESDNKESDIPVGQYEIHNYPEVLPEEEKFVPAFGEWVSTRRKPCPDEPGEYIAFRKIDEVQCRQSLMSVVDDNGKLRWSFAADRIMFWMPLPEDPSPEEY